MGMEAGKWILIVSAVLVAACGGEEEDTNTATVEGVVRGLCPRYCNQLSACSPGPVDSPLCDTNCVSQLCGLTDCATEVASSVRDECWADVDELSCDQAATLPNSCADLQIPVDLSATWWTVGDVVEEYCQRAMFDAERCGCSTQEAEEFLALCMDSCQDRSCADPYTGDELETWACMNVWGSSDCGDYTEPPPECDFLALPTPVCIES
jgi:hypothetical protein